MHETARNSSFSPFFDDPYRESTKPADKERPFSAVRLLSPNLAKCERATLGQASEPSIGPLLVVATAQNSGSD